MGKSSFHREMLLSYVPLCGFLLILNLQISSSFPVSTGLSDTDVDILKVLLHRLEESVSDQNSEENFIPPESNSPYVLNSEDEEDEEKTQTGLDEARIREFLSARKEDEEKRQTGLDEARIREFLSAKSLKNVRSDSSRRSSGCFGRRMDRIGSMSSLGCNTIGKYNPK
ncbi:natriuretic peptides B [Cololabis saira]|uniref:natriuretic peptides B n=1 Tax=Cololabis saira TaxID=129043 RepID=UPI002AD3745A|nr:natriuretic peptides B [Cololabis saira]